MDGTRGLGAWQWLFIIEGVITVAVAIGCYFVLPNFPRTTKWLTEEERALAVWYVLVLVLVLYMPPGQPALLWGDVHGTLMSRLGGWKRTLARTTG